MTCRGIKIATLTNKVISPIARDHRLFARGLLLLHRWPSLQSVKQACVICRICRGGFILVQSLLTDYPLGLKQVIPFETHGKMDCVFAASSWVMPILFGFGKTKAAKVFEVNSLAESSVVAMTDWNACQPMRPPLNRTYA
jgi:hypothetical protein